MSNGSPINIYTTEEIAIIREGGALLHRILRTLAAETADGVSTATLDERAHALATELGGTPAFLNYKPQGARKPFPGSVCISVNEEVVHGIPNQNAKTLKNGDVVVLDMGLKYKDMFTDSAITVVVGGDEHNPVGAKMIAAANKALESAINMVKPGVRTGSVGQVIESTVKATGPFTVPLELGGHGIGHSIHEDPFMPNFGKKGEGPMLREGMVLAIEPILTEKKPRIKLASDGYTYVTADGGLSVHVEHTIVVTSNGAEILTIS